MMMDHHDARGTTPIHVSVIKAIAGVIEVNPVNTPLRLSNYVSLDALDSICGRNTAEQKVGTTTLIFPYQEFGVFFTLVVQCDGTIMIFERQKPENSTSE